MSWSKPTDRTQGHDQTTIQEYGDGPTVSSRSLAARGRRRLTHLILIAALVLGCATALYVFRLGSIRSAAQTEMAGQLRIFVQIDDYVDSVQDAERIQRESLLNNDEKHLLRYDAACRNVKTQLAAMQKLAEQGEIYRSESARLTQLTESALAELDNCMNVRSNQGYAAALALLRQTRAQQLVADIESQAGKIRGQEQQEFDAAAREAEWAANLRNRVFAAGLLINVLFFWAAYRFVATELDKKQTATRDMAILQSVAVRCTKADFNMDDCLREVLIAARTLTNATKGTIRTLDENGEMHIVAHEGFDKKFLDEMQRLTKTTGQLCAVHLENDQHAGVENVRTSEALRGTPWVDLLLNAGVESFVAVPLASSSGCLLGLIAICFPHPGRPTDTQMRFLDLLARETADYLERKEIEKELMKAHAQLGNRAVHLEELVKERTTRLQEMIDDLEAFSYSLVHDMRGPLRAMQTFSEVLKEDCRQLGPIAQDYVHRIQVASQRIDHLIRDGLFYSRFMREDMPLCPLQPKELLLGIVETYPNFANVQKSINICGDFPIVQANEAALTQCFSHLLDNAIKFVAPGTTPSITVWSELHNNRARIYFHDNGVGIKREAYDKIFKIFQKLDREHRGTGIGLAIVKKAVERMGGSVGVTSDSEGSIFWLDLLRADTTADQPRAISNLQPTEAL